MTMDDDVDEGRGVTDGGWADRVSYGPLIHQEGCGQHQSIDEIHGYAVDSQSLV